MGGSFFGLRSLVVEFMGHDMTVPAALQRKSGQLDSPRRIDRDEASGGFLESEPGLLIPL